MRRLAALACCSAMAGCVAGPSRQEVLARFVGADETTLVQGMGVPTRSFTTGGVKFLAYDEQHTAVIPSPPGPIGWGYGYGYGWYTPFPPSVVQYGCETTFEVVQGRVRSFTLRGNACG